MKNEKERDEDEEYCRSRKRPEIKHTKKGERRNKKNAASYYDSHDAFNVTNKTPAFFAASPNPIPALVVVVVAVRISLVAACYQG